MSNLTENATWESVYQMETVDVVIGGPEGKANAQPKQLANRTKWLKTQIDNVISAAGLTPDASVLDQLAIAIQTLAGGSNIGVPFWHLGETAPVGAMEFTGQLLNRSAYSDLWAALNDADNNITLVSDADWLAGRTGCWSAGDGDTTFRAPKVLGDFLRAWDSTGLIDINRLLGSWQAATAFMGDGDGGNMPIPNLNNTQHQSVLSFDIETSPYAPEALTFNYTNASASSTANGMQTYGTASNEIDFARTRPRNTAWMLCFRYQ